MNLRRLLALPTAVLLACQSVAAVKYANTTTSDDSTTIIRVTSTKFVTEFRTTTTSSAAAEITGQTTINGMQVLAAPYMTYISYRWVQKYNATTVGTVQIIVNEATNKTTTTTKYHTELKSNGTGTDSVALLSRTDVDAQGTVTQVVPDLYNASMTITYPTHYVQYSDTMSFYGVAPITTLEDQDTCCGGTYFASRTPDHEPFPSPTFTTDTADPSGWLYVAFTGYDDPLPYENARGTDITSLWGGIDIEMTEPVCTYTSCTYTAQTALPASWAIQQVGIFATETTTLSIPDASTTAGTTRKTADAVTPSNSAIADTLPSETGAAEEESSSVAKESPETTVTATPETQTPLPSSDNSPGQTTEESEQQTPSANTPPQTSDGDNQGSPSANVPQQTPDQPSQASPSQAFSFSPETTESASPSPLPPAIIIGESTVTQQSSSQFVIGSQTLVPGSSIVLGSGSSTTVVAIQTDGGSAVIVVGSSSSLLQPLPQVTPAAQVSQSQAAPNIVIGDSTVTQESNSAFIIGSQTLSPGGSVAVGSGSSTTVVALASNGESAILQDGSSSFVVPVQTPTPQNSQSPIIVVGDSTVTQQPGSAFVIDGETLTPGGTVTVGSGSSTTVVALASNGNSVVVQDASSSQVVPVITPAPLVSFSTPAPSLVIDGSTITAQSGSTFVVSGQTLVPGSSITIGSQVVRLQSDGSNFVLQVGTSTEVIPIPSAIPITAAPLAIVVGDNTITAQTGSTFIISDQTLTPGGTITIGSSVIALQTTNSNLIVIYDGTSTSTLITPTPLPAFTFANSIISANSASAYVIDGQTLLPGDDIVVGGTTISLASVAGQLVIGTSTVDLAVSTTTGGLGGWIWSAFDAETTGSGVSTTSTGGSSSASASASASVTSTSGGTSSSSVPEATATTTGSGDRVMSSVLGGVVCFVLAVLMM